MIETINVNGVELAYTEQGCGAPVVFVHGAISDMRTWEHQLPAIGERYRAISYSRRFARPNDDIMPDEKDPWGRHVEDLAVLLQKIDAVPAHLVGNSQGAFISMVLAKQYPDLVKSLVLEEPAAMPLLSTSIPPRPFDLLKLVATKPKLVRTAVICGVRAILPMQKALARGDDGRGAEVFIRTVLGDEAFFSLSEGRKEQAFANASTILAFAQRPDVPDFSPQDARNLQVPVLFMQGETSPGWIPPFMDYIVGLLPNAERVVIPSASHLMHEDSPEAANVALLKFFGAL